MAWEPRSKHVSQLEHAGGAYTGIGLNDCGPACLTRYGREAGILDAGGPIPDQLSRVAEDVRGYPDGPSNGYVSIDQLQTWLGNHSVASHYTEDWGAARHAAWAILLVDAFQLSPPQYPQDWSWLGANTGVGDHLILGLPQYRGSGTYCNDPLAYDNGEADNSYDPDALAVAFRAALLLPPTHHGEDPAPPVPVPPAPAPTPTRRMASQRCGLKLVAKHGGHDLATIPAHGQLLDLGVRSGGFGHVQYRSIVGWIMADNIIPVS